MREYNLVTVANKIPREPYYTFREFFMSLQDVEPIILGKEAGEYGGLGSKPRLLYKAIKDGVIKEKHIVFCDCFDIVFTSHPDQLFTKYMHLGAPEFIISTERNCFPAGTKAEYDALNPPTSFKYLNSGMIVAETEAMLAVLEAMDAENIPNDYYDAVAQQQINPNDQEYYQKIFLQQPVPMVLDYFQDLCCTLHDVKAEDLAFLERGVMNVETKTYPSSFHFNGGAKTGGLREPILNFLQLSENIL